MGGLKDVGTALLNPYGYLTGEMAKAGQKGVEDVTGITDAKEAAKQQEEILRKQESEFKQQETKRKLRMSKARQGKRSLLFSEGTELGVSTKLGG